MSAHREWMYRRLLSNGEFNPAFLEGIADFIRFASGKPAYMDKDKIKCPCRKCDNKLYKSTNEVRFHISKFGFVNNYHVWRFQGETSSQSSRTSAMEIDYEAPTAYHTMVLEAVGTQYNIGNMEEPPNPDAQRLYDMLNAADNELWPGCKKHSQLSYVVRLMSLKAEYHWPERCYDRVTELIKEGFPSDDNLLPSSFYSTKRLLRGIGLPVQKIDCCPNSCMIFWRQDSELDNCRYCGESRFQDQNVDSTTRKKKQVAMTKMYYFPLIPRVQRLYASNATAAEMRWHASSPDDGVRPKR